jgi:O-antigen ligase
MTAPRSAALRLPLLCATLFLSALAFSAAFTSFLHPKEMLLAAGLLALSTIGAMAGVNPCSGFRFFFPLWAGWLYLALWHGLLHPPLLHGAALLELARLAILLLLASITYDLCQSPRHAAWLLRSMVAGAAACASLALLQYFDLALRLFPRFPHYDQKMYSVFGNQDLLGSYLALALAIIPLGRIRGPRDAVLRMLAGAPILCALALSGSRSAWLAAAMGLLMALARMRPRRHALAGAALLLAATLLCIAFAPQRTLSRISNTFAPGDTGAWVRLWTWDGALRMACAYPLAGVGPANFQFHSPRFMGEALHAPGGDKHAHNALHAVYAESEPIQFLCESGLLGLLFAGWWLWVLLRRRGPAWSGIAAMALVSCFSFPLHSPPHALAALLLCGTLRPRHVSHRPAMERPPNTRAATRALPLAALVLITLLSWVHWIPSALTARADRASATAADAVVQYRRALDWTPDLFETGELRLHYAIALALSSQHEGNSITPKTLFAAIEKTAQRLDTGEVHRLRGRCYHHHGKHAEALAAFRAALYRWPGDIFSQQSIAAIESMREGSK